MNLRASLFLCLMALSLPAFSIIQTQTLVAQDALSIRFEDKRSATITQEGEPIILAIRKDIRRNMRQATRYCDKGSDDYSEDRCLEHNRYLSNAYREFSGQYREGTDKWRENEARRSEYQSVVDEILAKRKAELKKDCCQCCETLESGDSLDLD